jgi:hypothetical protein
MPLHTSEANWRSNQGYVLVIQRKSSGISFICVIRVQKKIIMSEAYVKKEIINNIATIEFFHPEHLKLKGGQPVAVR